jgi:chorismate dehydratase
MIQLSAVSYLNTKPFLFGLKLAKMSDLEISVDMPSECARKLIENEVDLGLIPVAVIPALKEAHILPGFCIGADGPVESVKLYSQVPLEEIKTILLDYQSRTSVTLVRVLASEFWKISPEWEKASEGFENAVAGTTAAVIIGDRTFTLNGKFPYEYDLAGEWKKMTGLPFVFACWVSNKKLPDDFIQRFSQAMELGLGHLPEVVKEESPKYAPFNVENYLSKSLKLRLDRRAEEGLGMFLEKMKQLPALP